MSRYLFAILSILIILIPSQLFAGEQSNQKKQVISLYKNYKTNLGQGKNEEALKLATQIYALTPISYGKISKTHATAAFNLASINDLLGNKKDAAKFYRENLDILDEMKILKDEKYLMKLKLLSRAYLKSKEFEESVKYGEMGVNLAKDLNVPDKTLAEYELRLGISYAKSYEMESMGWGHFNKGSKARDHINKGYNLFLKSYGEHHFKTAYAKFWQAKTDMAHEKNSSAAKKLEEVLDIYKERLPVGHSLILQVHIFLVKMYEQLGQKDKSTEHCIAVANEQLVGLDGEFQLLYKEAPIYPTSAAFSERSGYVVAGFTVDEFGQTGDIKIIETTDKVFNEPSIEALSKFRYAPSIVNGKRVKTEGVLHKVTFQMEN